MPAILTVEAAVHAAAEVLRSMGAVEVFVFGSALTPRWKTSSDIDMAVRGLAPEFYISAVTKASDAAGRFIDLVDLDEDSPKVRFLLGSGELVRV